MQSTIFMSRLCSKFLNENTNKEESNNKHNYVYWVSDNHKWYIGVRSSIEDPSIDFWKYGTSSYRKQEILTSPEIFKVYILADFDNRKEANAYEVFLHNYFDVKYNKKFWNKSNAETGFYIDTKGTVSVFDREEGKYKRVSKEEYLSNLARYSAPGTKQVTVALKSNPDNFFNISADEFYSNKNLYITTSREGYVLCRKRGETGKYSKIPKELYNKGEYETPSEVRSRNNNKIAVEVNGVRVYKNIEDITKEDKVIGTNVAVDIDGTPRYITLKEFLLGNYKRYQFKTINVFRVRENKFSFIRDIDKDKDDILFNCKNRSVIFTCEKSKIDKLNYPKVIKNYLKENINKPTLIPIIIFEEMKALNIDVKLGFKPSNMGCVNVYEISTQKTIKIPKEEYYNNKDKYIATGAKLKKYLLEQAQQS